MKTVWEKLDKDGVKAVMDFNEEYRQFLTKSKTERTFVTNTEAFALENGFKSFPRIKSRGSCVCREP